MVGSSVHPCAQLSNPIRTKEPSSLSINRYAIGCLCIVFISSTVLPMFFYPPEWCVTR
jgi:hypothetical protein